MDNERTTERLMGALTPYFSPPIAKALLGLSLRRANVGEEQLDFGAIPGIIVALERALPAYIADQARRTDCVQGLRRLLALVPRPGDARHGDRAPTGDRAETSAVIRIRTADDITSACDAGREIARSVGLSHVDQTKFATAISELARNILLYAKEGDVRVSSIAGPRRGVEVLAADEGPGIADTGAVMGAAYRSRTGMGMGLKGTRRLMDHFELASTPGAGTTVVARKFLP